MQLTLTLKMTTAQVVESQSCWSNLLVKWLLGSNLSHYHMGLTKTALPPESLLYGKDNLLSFSTVWMKRSAHWLFLSVKVASLTAMVFFAFISQWESAVQIKNSHIIINKYIPWVSKIIRQFFSLICLKQINLDSTSNLYTTFLRITMIFPEVLTVEYCR